MNTRIKSARIKRTYAPPKYRDWWVKDHWEFFLRVHAWDNDPLRKIILSV